MRADSSALLPIGRGVIVMIICRWVFLVSFGEEATEAKQATAAIPTTSHIANAGRHIQYRIHRHPFYRVRLN